MEKIRELIDFLNYHSRLYEQGKPEISDKNWDDKYFELKSLEEEFQIIYPDSPTQTVIYDVVNKLEKVEHNHQMLSLDKTKDWNEFVRYFNHHNVIGMLKLDGLTCSLKYIDGKLYSAETRGNGEVGENILHNIKLVKNIPQTISYKNELIIDGEIICTYKDFEAFKDEYSHPRNFAAGSIRLLNSKESSKRNLKFIVWNVISNVETNSFLQSLNFVENLGFTVVPWTSGFDLDAKAFLIEQAERLGYPIDGLVGRFDDIEYGKNLGATGHHAKAAYAFKFYDDVYVSHLINIDYSIGRTGVLTPVARFEPIDIDGTEIERASLHNLTVMEQLLGTPYYGQEIAIFKANDIIPQIAHSIKKEVELHQQIHIPATCPICGALLDIECENESEVLKCNNSQCEGKLINVIDHFCSKQGLDIKGLSKATLEKLIGWGWINNIVDLFKLSQFRQDWIKVPGFGIKSVDNILNAIEIAKNCELDKFLAALGIPLIGSSASKDLAKHFGSWSNFIKAVDNGYNFFELPNFGDEMHYAISSYNYDLAKELANSFLNISDNNDNCQSEAKTLADMTIVITGKLNHFKNRDELKSLIEAKGGKVAGSVSKKTSYLINNDIDSASSKNQTAKSYNIPILSEEDFIEMFGE